MANSSLLLLNWSLNSLELGIQSLFKWLSQLWRFITACSSRCKWLVNVIKVFTGSSDGELESEVHSANSSGSPNKPDLRLILLGPSSGGRTSLAATLLGNSETRATMGPLMESTKRKAVVEGREITVIDTPDLLGHSLESNSRAKEALRCLQLTSPGPHAFLLVFQAPGSSMGTDHNASQALQATLKLFGDGVIEYIIPVLTHADHLGKRCTVDQLLDVDSGSLRRVVSLCCQKPELVDNRADRPPETQSVMRRQLLGRVTELKKLRGHFIHELQSREDRMREELLADMSSALARKVGHM
ncbi:GTPase IMAP family member 1-like [Mastacembelus armatus]|uniref:GTPase IMAP family member 1-like n=1 Tax=Mastacembelus armatus TaxID=205130 RepID=UPI000E45DF77|nr:GTPase IMAP family member 1-like [Mastacembelus armatus]